MPDVIGVVGVDVAAKTLALDKARTIALKAKRWVSCFMWVAPIFV